MASITQDNRLLSITTPAGKDVLLLDAVSGSEEISHPFSFDLRLLADIENGMDAKVKPADLVGKAVTVSIRLADGSQRYLHGLIHRFVVGGRGPLFQEYRIEMVPWLTLLGHASSCRIFQGKTIPEVIEAVFKAHGYSDYTLKLTKTYTPLDYCVQYRETDLNFVQRLMEEEGIFYFFEHTSSKHTLILGDSISAHQPCPGQSKATFGTTTGDEDLVTDWEERHELFTGKWTMRDYHFELPTNNLEVSEPAVGVAQAAKKLEMYDYPGEYAQRFNKTGERLGNVKSEGQKLVKLRMEEAESRGEVAEGSSTCRAFAPGYKVTVDSLGNQQVKGTYVLTSVQHSVTQAPAYLSVDGGGGQFYQNRFTAIPASQSTPFRPARLAPKPVIQGPQSALVVDESKSGNTEEIWPDKYGRVRVRFPWDRDGFSACWVRVAQPRAGKLGGQLWIPRVGDEVLVAFIEGDPDHPVIVGSVFNANNMPIYDLPSNKTQNGIKTRSSPKGGSDNFNEVRFEDKKGSEQISVQAEKDLISLIKNDETRTVNNDRTTTIGNNETKTVKKGDEKITLEKGSQTVKIFKDQSTTIDTGDCTLTVSQGNQSTNVKMGNISTEAGMGNISTVAKMGNISTEAKMGNISTEAKLGNWTLKTDLGQVTIEALQGIELKVGSSSIKVDMMGVTIKGMMINVQGEVQTQVKGLMCQVNGDAMLMAKGGITMIG